MKQSNKKRLLHKNTDTQQVRLLPGVHIALVCPSGVPSDGIRRSPVRQPHGAVVEQFSGARLAFLLRLCTAQHGAASYNGVLTNIKIANV